MCNWKCVNPSCTLPLSIPEVACPPPHTQNLVFYTWHEAEIYTSNKYRLTKDIEWCRQCFGHVTHMYFTDLKTIFADININGKMTSSMNFFYQGELLVKDSSWYYLQIPRYCMVVNFPYNSWSANSDHPKTRTILRMLRGLVRGYFNFKMFATKFCSPGQTIAQVVLEL